MLKKGGLILFQGDSITDAGRKRRKSEDLGKGYSLMIKKILDKKRPEANYRYLNRGISGNRARDLLDRWDKDCIALQPDTVSILIGVNDTWRRYTGNDPISHELFENQVETLIESTLEQTRANLILLNPFLLDINEQVSSMREDLIHKQESIRQLAKKYNQTFIDFDAAFKTASSNQGPDFYAADGVHPTKAGYELMADLWVEKVLN